MSILTECSEAARSGVSLWDRDWEGLVHDHLTRKKGLRTEMGLSDPSRGNASLRSSPAAGPLWRLFLKQRSGLVLLCFALFPRKGQKIKKMY